MNRQYVDLEVSQTKFERQVGDFYALRDEYERRGWFLVEAAFPTVFVVIGLPQLRPAAILCGVLLDYSNYDAEPPSVVLVDPFTRRPYKHAELPTVMNKALPSQSLAVEGLPGQLQLRGAQPLMQAHAPDEVPFLCLAGTREYHAHPGHSGDSWTLHRASGAGSLVRILDIIHRYGAAPIQGYGVQLVPQINFDPGVPPE